MEGAENVVGNHEGWFDEADSSSFIFDNLMVIDDLLLISRSGGLGRSSAAVCLVCLVCTSISSIFSACD